MKKIDLRVEENGVISLPRKYLNEIGITTQETENVFLRKIKDKVFKLERIEECNELEKLNTQIKNFKVFLSEDFMEKNGIDINDVCRIEKKENKIIFNFLDVKLFRCPDCGKNTAVHFVEERRYKFYYYDKQGEETNIKVPHYSKTYNREGFECINPKCLYCEYYD